MCVEDTALLVCDAIVELSSIERSSFGANQMSIRGKVGPRAICLGGERSAIPFGAFGSDLTWIAYFSPSMIPEHGSLWMRRDSSATCVVSEAAG